MDHTDKKIQTDNIYTINEVENEILYYIRNNNIDLETLRLFIHESHINNSTEPYIVDVEDITDDEDDNDVTNEIELAKNTHKHNTESRVQNIADNIKTALIKSFLLEPANDRATVIMNPTSTQTTTNKGTRQGLTSRKNQPRNKRRRKLQYIEYQPLYESPLLYDPLLPFFMNENLSLHNPMNNTPLLESNNGQQQPSVGNFALPFLFTNKQLQISNTPDGTDGNDLLHQTQHTSVVHNQLNPVNYQEIPLRPTQPREKQPHTIIGLQDKLPFISQNRSRSFETPSINDSNGQATFFNNVPIQKDADPAPFIDPLRPTVQVDRNPAHLTYDTWRALQNQHLSSDNVQQYVSNHTQMNNNLVAAQLNNNIRPRNAPELETQMSNLVQPSSPKKKPYARKTRKPQSKTGNRKSKGTKLTTTTTTTTGTSSEFAPNLANIEYERRQFPNSESARTVMPQMWNFGNSDFVRTAFPPAVQPISNAENTRTAIPSGLQHVPNLMPSRSSLPYETHQLSNNDNAFPCGTAFPLAVQPISNTENTKTTIPSGLQHVSNLLQSRSSLPYETRQLSNNDNVFPCGTAFPPAVQPISNAENTRTTIPSGLQHVPNLLSSRSSLPYETRQLSNNDNAFPCGTAFPLAVQPISNTENTRTTIPSGLQHVSNLLPSSSSLPYETRQLSNNDNVFPCATAFPPAVQPTSNAENTRTTIPSGLEHVPNLLPSRSSLPYETRQLSNNDNAFPRGMWPMPNSEAQRTALQANTQFYSEPERNATMPQEAHPQSTDNSQHINNNTWALHGNGYLPYTETLRLNNMPHLPNRPYLPNYERYMRSILPHQTLIPQPRIGLLGNIPQPRAPAYYHNQQTNSHPIMPHPYGWQLPR